MKSEEEIRKKLIWIKNYGTNETPVLSEPAQAYDEGFIDALKWVLEE